MINIEQIKSKFVAYKTEVRLILKDLEIKEKEYNSLKTYVESLLKARVIVAEAGKYTQTYLKDYIEGLVSQALQAVFEDDYQFIVDFDIKRNQVETKFHLQVKDQKMELKDTCGGGILDVASFALRVVLWSIQNPKSDNVIILDEPLKFLHGKMENAMKMLKDLSKKLEIQFIIVSQIPEIAEQADKLFEVTLNDEYSIVKEINGYNNKLGVYEKT